MLTKVGPNKLNFYSGIICFIILFPVVFGYFAYHLISTLSKPGIHETNISIWVVTVILLLFEGRYMPKVYAMPYRIIVDDELKTFELKYPLKKSKLIRRENMLSYGHTTIKISTRAGTTIYSGIYLHLGDGGKVLLANETLKRKDMFMSNRCCFAGVLKNWKTNSFFLTTK